MIYLLLAVCSSAFISVIMKAGEGRIKNNISALAVNYLTCLLLGIVYSAGSGTLIVDPVKGRVTIILGLITGAFYVGSFILYQYNILKNGVVMSSTFMKLGVLVPTILSIIVFGEHPRLMQAIGICLAVAAIIVVNSKETDENTITAPKLLVLVLLSGGTCDAMSKIYEELGPAEYSSQFLLYTFAVAFVLCSLTALIRGQRVAREDLLFGFLIGVPNYYSARFLLLALSNVPAIIAYPVFSAGTIVLVGAAGVLLFREKMTRRQWIAVGIIIISMILLNA
jgi:drug/metabolite transporter (DMT)-like permease